MSARLICRTGRAAGTDIVVKAPVSLGASPESDVRLVAEGVSRKHARLYLEEDVCWIEDDGSTNGTFVNGQRVQKFRLRHLDVVTLARSVDLIFLQKDDQEVEESAPSLLEASIQWLNGPEQGNVFDLSMGETTVGRDWSCTVVIEEPVVSKVHLKITRLADYLTLQDLGSTNGTSVNDRPVENIRVLDGQETVTLGDTISFRVNVRRDPSAGVVSKPAEDTMVAQSFDQEWRTRLIWSADELDEIAAVQAKIKEAKKVAPDEPAAKKGKKKAAPAPKKPAAAPAKQAVVEEGREGTVLDPDALREAKAAPDGVLAAARRAKEGGQEEPGGEGTVLDPDALREAKAAPDGVLAAARRAKEGGQEEPGDLSAEETMLDPDAARKVQEAPNLVVAAAKRAKKSAPAEAGERTRVEASAEPEPVPDAVAKAAKAASESQPRITGIKLVDETRTISLNPGRHVVGRGFNARVNLDVEGVSREHALIEFDGLGVWVEDLDSVNGTVVNGKPFEGKQRVYDGDLLDFAGVKLRVEVVRKNE